MEGQLTEACRHQDWKTARRLFREKPELIWSENSKYDNTPAHEIAHHGHARVMEDMILAIIDTHPHLETRNRILRNVFVEKSSIYRTLPLHIAAARGHLKCVKLLIRYMGPSILEIVDKMRGSDFTPSHWAASYDRVGMLKFIAQRAPSGIKVFQVKDKYGKTPVDKLNNSNKKYFTPKRILRLGLENELILIPHIPGHLPSLMLGVVRQNTETYIHRLTKRR